MRLPSRSWFPCVCLLSLLLAVPALAGAKKQQDSNVLGEGFDPREAQIIGWSEDEERFVFRVYTDTTEAEEWDAGKVEEVDPLRGKDGFCKGYVNHEGKPFKGALEFQVFDKRGRVEVLPIQDSGDCTPPKKAAQRLAEAKKRLAALGISLERRGAALIPKKGEMRLEVKEGARAPYVLEVFDDTKTYSLEENEDMNALQGTVRLIVHRGGQQRVVWEKQINDMNPTELGEYVRSVARVDVSPSGKRVVMLHRSKLGEMQTKTNKLWMEAVVELPPGDATTKPK